MQCLTGEIFYFHRAGDIILILNLFLHYTDAIRCFKSFAGTKVVKHSLVISKRDQQCFVSLERCNVSIFENNHYFLVSIDIGRNLVVL